MNTIHSDEHQALTLSAAEQSMTLLKNSKSILPLDPTKYKGKFAIIGPGQNVTYEMQGGYSGPTAPIVSPGDVLSQRLGADKLVWAVGSVKNDTANIATAVATVAAADVDLAIVFVKDVYVAEFSDRTDLALQYGQQQLVKEVAAVGKPVILVVVAGHTLALETEKKLCDAILYAFLPSEAGGSAIVNTLLGDNAPAGRLPITLYPRSILFERDPGDMSLRGGPGITYMHYPANKTVFPLGFGLSYSTFTFEWSADAASAASAASAADAATEAGDNVGASGSRDANGGRASIVNGGRMILVAPETRFDELSLPSVNVTNTGAVRSAVTVQGFILDVRLADASAVGDASPPQRELFDFDKVLLEPGQSKVAALKLPASVLALGTGEGDLAILEGEYDLAVGGGCL